MLVEPALAFKRLAAWAITSETLVKCGVKSTTKSGRVPRVFGGRRERDLRIDRRDPSEGWEHDHADTAGNLQAFGSGKT